MKRILILFTVLYFPLFAGIPVKGEFSRPTQQLIERESRNKIEKNLKKIKVPQDLFSFFDQIALSEEWGHIGYHGSNQDYRIYQDIIRFVLEEIVGIKIREDFHFLRIPGDKDLNINTMEDFYKFWDKKIDNNSCLRAKQLFSLNYGIYSNFENKGSCSLVLFVKDKSKNKVHYPKYLSSFFKELGIPPKAAKALFNLAHKRLDGSGGVLLRIRENSHLTDPNGEAYNFADKVCYPCKRGGCPWGRHTVSEMFERMAFNRYLNEEIKISPQLRILLNNRYTLNPFSPLSLERWDLYDADTIALYTEEMRDFIKALDFDRVKVEKYREMLFSLWFGK